MFISYFECIILDVPTDVGVAYVSPNVFGCRRWIQHTHTFDYLCLHEVWLDGNDKLEDNSVCLKIRDKNNALPLSVCIAPVDEFTHTHITLTVLLSYRDGTCVCFYLHTADVNKSVLATLVHAHRGEICIYAVIEFFKV